MLQFGSILRPVSRPNIRPNRVCGSWHSKQFLLSGFERAPRRISNSRALVSLQAVQRQQLGFMSTQARSAVEVAYAAIDPDANARLEALRDHSNELGRLIAQSEANMRSLSELSGGHLVEAILKVRETAGDAARGSTDEAWNTVQALFATLGEDELVDPTISPSTLLYRLFHEEGVRMFDPAPLRAHCRCSQDRILGVLKSFPVEERATMVEEDGHIRVTCEYCSRTYEVEPDKVDGEG